MSKTNKERLQDNNIELQNIKTGINNLPDNPDIEPIYDVSKPESYRTSLLKTANSGENSFNYQGDYWSYSYYHWPYQHYLYKNGTQLVYKISDEGPYIIFNATDEYVDYVCTENSSSSSNSNVILYRCFVADKSIVSKKVNIGISRVNIMKITSNIIAIKGTPNLYHIDYDTGKVTIISNSSNFIYALSEDLISNNATNITKLLDIHKSIIYSYNSKVTFINKVQDRIMLGNDLYELNLDKSAGNLIKSNVLDFYENTSAIVHLAGNYYIYSPSGLVGGRSNVSRPTGKLLYFDSNTDDFIIVEDLYNLNAGYVDNSSGAAMYGGMCWTFTNQTDNYLKYFNKYDENNKKIIGYRKGSNILYFPKTSSVGDSKILEGNQFFDTLLTLIVGTMPNNGVLNYTPTTSQQTIPAGYTSGGIVAAIDYSGQGALSPQDTATAEAQIKDLFGEGE